MSFRDVSTAKLPGLVSAVTVGAQLAYAVSEPRDSLQLGIGPLPMLQVTGVYQGSTRTRCQRLGFRLIAPNLQKLLPMSLVISEYL